MSLFQRERRDIFDMRYEMAPKTRGPFVIARLLALALFIFYLWKVDGWRGLEVLLVYAAYNTVMFYWNKALQDGEPR